MKKRSGLQLLLMAILVLLFASTQASADVYTFATVPSSGDIQGPPGSTIGWGYTITNDSATEWLVTANLSADVFLDSTPDASTFDLPIIAPLTTLTVPYDQSTGAGLFALTWDAGAPIGFTNTGVFTLDAEWWTGDPLAGGSFIMDAAEETAAYLATVSAPTAPSSVPEPGSILLLSTVLAMVIAAKRVRAC